MYAMRFTDPYLWVKFAESITVSNPATGEIDYYSNKPTDTNLNPSLNQGEIRAGVSNPIVATIPSDVNVTFEANTADFNLAMRALQVGGLHGFGAPTFGCYDYTAATSGEVVLESSWRGTPVAGQGYDSVFCYVQEVGSGSQVRVDGNPYQLGDDKTILGFAATAGKTYKIWYWVSEPSTEYVKALANMDPAVRRVEVVQPVYANESGSADNTGTRIGSLVTIIPYLKLNGSGGVSGNNSSNSTTSISGMALAYDEAVVQAGCGACGDASSTLYDMLFVPCEGSGNIQGLTVVGGLVTVAPGETKQIEAWLVVNGSLVKPDPAFLTFEGTLSGGNVAVTGIITAPSTETEGNFTATYSKGGETFEFAGYIEVVAP